MQNNFEFIDFEPLLIKFWDNKVEHRWFHDFAEQHVEFKVTDEIAETYDVFRVYIAGSKGTVYIVFKSDWFLKRESVDVSENLMNQTFALSEEEMDDFLTSIDETLFGDTWVVAPPSTIVIKNSKDYQKVRDDQYANGAYQFFNSEFQDELSEFIGDEYRLTFLSPDVALCKDSAGDVWFDS